MLSRCILGVPPAAVYEFISCASFAGVLLPLLSRRIKALRPGSFPFTAARCFGGGVVVATGFIHVFPEGVALLGNACLGWPDYPVSLPA